jgi:hypothetical protein
MASHNRITALMLSSRRAAMAQPLPDADHLTAWAAHREALDVGRIIESHHAALAAIAAPGRSGATASVTQEEELIRDYRLELEKARGVLEALDAALSKLLTGLVRHGI